MDPESKRVLGGSLRIFGGSTPVEEWKEAGLDGGKSGIVIQVQQGFCDYTRNSEDEMALQSPRHYGERERGIYIHVLIIIR